jgi:hypothetical protein
MWDARSIEEQFCNLYITGIVFDDEYVNVWVHASPSERLIGLLYHNNVIVEWKSAVIVSEGFL